MVKNLCSSNKKSKNKEIREMNSITRMESLVMKLPTDNENIETESVQKSSMKKTKIKLLKIKGYSPNYQHVEFVEYTFQ